MSSRGRTQDPPPKNKNFSGGGRLLGGKNRVPPPTKKILFLGEGTLYFSPNPPPPNFFFFLGGGPVYALDFWSLSRGFWGCLQSAGSRSGGRGGGRKQGERVIQIDSNIEPLDRCKYPLVTWYGKFWREPCEGLNGLNEVSSLALKRSLEDAETIRLETAKQTWKGVSGTSWEEPSWQIQEPNSQIQETSVQIQETSVQIQ